MRILAVLSRVTEQPGTREWSEGAPSSEPVKNIENIGVVIGPEAQAGGRGNRTPAVVPEQGAEILGVPAQGNPEGGAPTFAGFSVGDFGFVKGESVQMEMGGQVANHGAEVKVAAGGLEEEQAIGCEFREEELKGLTREEVQGRHVGAESISDNQVEVLGRSFVQSESSVADNEAGGEGVTAVEIGEPVGVLGQADHGRVDFIEGPVLGGLGVSSQGACAQTDDGDVAGVGSRVERGHELAAGSRPVEIGQGFSLTLRGDELQAVQSRAVIETMETRFRIACHSQGTKEIPFDMEGVAVNGSKGKAR